MGVVRWTLATALALFGLATLDLLSWKWVVLGVALYLAPLAGQFVPNVHVRIWSLWFGVFVAFQTALSAVIFDVDFVSLTPNLDTVVEVTEGLPGISGKQYVTTDAKGFRVTRPVAYTADDSYRIFVIGGSTTEQIFLDDRKTWTHLLQENLAALGKTDVEVINTGVSGLRGPNHVATLKHVLAFHPDMIVFLMGINDWNHHIKQTFAVEKESGLSAWKLRRQLLLRNSMLGRLVAGLTNRLTAEPVEPGTVVEERGEYYTNQRGSLDRAEKREFLPQTVDPEYAAILREISQLCNGVRCVFMTQPTGYVPAADAAFKAGFWMTPPNEDYALTFDSMIHIASLYNSHLERFTAENGHGFCDIASSITPGYDVFYDECHFNEQGAERVGTLLTACVAPLVK